MCIRDSSETSPIFTSGFSFSSESSLLKIDLIHEKPSLSWAERVGLANTMPSIQNAFSKDFFIFGIKNYHYLSRSQFFLIILYRQNPHHNKSRYRQKSSGRPDRGIAVNGKTICPQLLCVGFLSCPRVGGADLFYG